MNGTFFVYDGPQGSITRELREGLTCWDAYNAQGQHLGTFISEVTARRALTEAPIRSQP
jgi:hypothetical protein